MYKILVDLYERYTTIQVNNEWIYKLWFPKPLDDFFVTEDLTQPSK